MKIRLIILLIALGLGANAQTGVWRNFNTTGKQFFVISAGDTVWRTSGGVNGYVYDLSAQKIRNTFAVDADVLHKTGDEVKNGILTIAYPDNTAYSTQFNWNGLTANAGRGRISFEDNLAEINYKEILRFNKNNGVNRIIFDDLEIKNNVNSNKVLWTGDAAPISPSGSYVQLSPLSYQDGSIKLTNGSGSITDYTATGLSWGASQITPSAGLKFDVGSGYFNFDEGGTRVFHIGSLSDDAYNWFRSMTGFKNGITIENTPTTSTSNDDILTRDKTSGEVKVVNSKTYVDRLNNINEKINGEKTFTNVLKVIHNTDSSNVFYQRFQDTTGVDLLTFGQIGLSNSAPAIKLMGRNISEEPEFFIGHNETRNFGWITQSSFGNATYVFNRRNAGVDHNVYTISNASGNLSYKTTDTTHTVNIGGSLNAQGVISTDQHLVGTYFSTSPENTSGSTGAFRMANNLGVVSRNANNTLDATLIKMSASNQVTISDEGWNVLINGNTNVNGNITANNLQSGTYTPTLSGVSGLTSVTDATNWHYIRVGNQVTVTGSCVFTGNDTSSAGSVNFTLPISSNLVDMADLTGQGVASNMGFDRILCLTGSSSTGSIIAAYQTPPTISFPTLLHISFTYTIK